MAVRQDIALLDNDLIIQDGDFVIADSDQQHIEDTINAFPGWWKENPQDGVGAIAYISSSGNLQQLARDIKLQLQSDGYTVGNPQISFVDGQLKINPDATII